MTIYFQFMRDSLFNTHPSWFILNYCENLSLSLTSGMEGLNQPLWEWGQARLQLHLINLGWTRTSLNVLKPNLKISNFIKKQTKNIFLNNLYLFIQPFTYIVQLPKPNLIKINFKNFKLIN